MYLETSPYTHFQPAVESSIYPPIPPRFSNYQSVHLKGLGLVPEFLHQTICDPPLIGSLSRESPLRMMLQSEVYSSVPQFPPNESLSIEEESIERSRLQSNSYFGFHDDHSICRNIPQAIQHPPSIGFLNHECVNCGIVLHASQWRPDGAGNYLCASCANPTTNQLDISQLSSFTINESPEPEPFDCDFPRQLTTQTPIAVAPNRFSHKKGCCENYINELSTITPINSPHRRQTANSRIGVVCSNCRTTQTSLWRRTPEGSAVCNACGLYRKMHGCPRPLSLRKDSIQTRKRRPQKRRSCDPSSLALKTDSQIPSPPQRHHNDKHLFSICSRKTTFQQTSCAYQFCGHRQTPSNAYHRFPSKAPAASISVSQMHFGESECPICSLALPFTNRWSPEPDYQYLINNQTTNSNHNNPLVYPDFRLNFNSAETSYT